MRNLKSKIGVSSWWEPKKYVSDNGEDLFVIDFFKNKKNGYLMDIGAADGVTGSNSFKLLDEYNWNGLLVEASKTHIDNLNTLYSDEEGVDCFFGAIHNEKKESNFFQSDGKFIGHSNINNNNDQWFSHSYIVECMDINSILHKFSVPQNIDFISLDIEGSEEHVLNYWDFEKYKVSLWCIENSFRFQSILLNNGFEKIATIGEINDFWKLKI